MGNYAAPSHPPPPKVPDGWKPIWNEQYSEYFFVNLLTSQSTWEKPKESASEDSGNMSQDRSLNPFSRKKETDEEMARRLQIEERSRIGHQNSSSIDRGHASEYYSGAPVSHGPLDQEGVHNGPNGTNGGNRGSSGTGLRDKIKAKLGSNSTGGGHHPLQQAPFGYGPSMTMGGRVYAPPPQPYGYGMHPQPMYMQQPMRRRQGMGPGGGAALGLGGGLLGGMMLGNAMNSGQQDAYQDGFADGADFDGGDFDGGDFGE